MGDAVDFLFGDESSKGIGFQRDDNQRRQEFIEEQGALARQDVLDIFPRGQETMQQGYRAASDILRRAPYGQVQTLQNASQRAQESLLGGMNEYRRAIMGQPSEMQNNFYRNPLGMRPVTVGAGAEPLNAFGQSQRPLFLGSQAQDVEEMKMRRNDPDNHWQLASPNKDVNLYPEQFREPVRYDFDKKQAQGGVNTQMPSAKGNNAQLYNDALSGLMSEINWSNV